MRLVTKALILQKARPFLAANSNPESAELVLFGWPFDGTCSFRAGTRFGPGAIREASEVLESYCPVARRDLEDVRFADVGDLPVPPGDLQTSLDMAYRMATAIRSAGQIPAVLGGEHTLSLPLIRAAHEADPNLAVIHFDAHFDLRNQYLGVETCHATVLRRVSDFIQPSHILHIGQRSGIKEEFDRSELLGNYCPASAKPEDICQWVGDRPIYVTVDLDVLDPSVLPGTGTPEPGGVSFATLQGWLQGLSSCRWRGWDVVELSPDYDRTQVSSIVAAKVTRTMIFTSTSQTA
ncbi:agmatinase [bacterium]|nr:agmatinase [bacterium]MBU1984841.1 agmatinase [bacterium]